MFSNISTKTLAKIAVYGAIGVCTTGMILQSKVKERIKQTEFYKEALSTLRKHQGAVYLLGEPIKDGSITLDSKINRCDDKTAQIQVPVRGPKDRGTLYFWAYKPSPNDKWNVNRMELELKSDSSKRLLIKNEPSPFDS